MQMAGVRCNRYYRTNAKITAVIKNTLRTLLLYIIHRVRDKERHCGDIGNGKTWLNGRKRENTSE